MTHALNTAADSLRLSPEFSPTPGTPLLPVLRLGPDAWPGTTVSIPPPGG